MRVRSSVAVAAIAALLGSLIVASEARAQGLPDPRGAVVANGQSAAVDDATALTVNPAGLAHIQGVELQSGWVTRIGSSAAFDQQGDLVAVVSGPLGVIAGGLGLQLPASSSAPARRS